MRRHWPVQLIVITAVVLGGWLLSHAATVTLLWDPVTGATAYRIYRSADQGVTWVQAAEVADPTAQLLGEPDAGLLLYRASAVNSQGEAVRMEFGAWYNGTWLPIPPPAGLGIQ